MAQGPFSAGIVRNDSALCWRDRGNAVNLLRSAHADREEVLGPEGARVNRTHCEEDLMTGFDDKDEFATDSDNL